jgi:uncharacterized protein (TIGR02271 family)
MQQSTVVGIFQDRDQAEQAVTELRNAGFRNDQIEFAGHGTATGGGLLASLKSLFTGEDTTTDHVYNELVGIGLPTQDAHYYQQEYEAGRSIVAVIDADASKLQEASTTLARYGGYGASRLAAQTANDDTSAGTLTQTANGTRTAPTAAQDTVVDTQGERDLQLREEQLQVYKRPVQVGEVQLRKEVVAEQQTLNVPVTHEEVYIERRPASGRVTDTTPIGEGDSIRIPVREEQVNVTKQTVETGEVEIGKRPVQEIQQVRDTVRREAAHIEREGDAPIHDTKIDPFHPSKKDVEDLLDE